jgi:hypothetical protein
VGLTAIVFPELLWWKLKPKSFNILTKRGILPLEVVGILMMLTERKTCFQVDDNTTLFEKKVRAEDLLCRLQAGEAVSFERCIITCLADNHEGHPVTPEQVCFFFTCLHYKNLLEICHFPVCWQNNLKKKCILALSVFASPFSKLQSIMSVERRSVGLYLYSVTLYDLDRIFLKC